MMGGHPNDASPLSLRNVPFAIQVGANDAAFHRNEVAAEWGKKLDDLQRRDPSGYAHFTELHTGKGHWMDLEDRKAIPGWRGSRAIRCRRKSHGIKTTVTHARFLLAVATGE